jgi:hypothetical protein
MATILTLAQHLYTWKRQAMSTARTRMPGFAYLEETIDMDRQMVKIGKHIKVVN